MKKSLVNSLLLASVTFAEPGIENELAFGTGTGNFAPDAEWTLVMEQDAGLGTLSAENILYQPLIEETPKNWEGEATLIYGINPIEWIGLSVGGRLGYGTTSPTPWGLAVMSPSYSWKSTGMEIADDNEFSWNFRDKSTTYTNTLGIFQPLGIVSSFDFAIVAEYEGCITLKKGSTWEDAFEAGISLAKEHFGLSLLWTTAIRPETSHGVKVALAHNL